MEILMPVQMLTEENRSHQGIHSEMDMDTPQVTEFNSVTQGVDVPDTEDGMDLSEIFKYILSPDIWPVTRQVLMESEEASELFNDSSYTGSEQWMIDLQEAIAPHIVPGIPLQCSLRIQQQPIEIDVLLNT